MRSLVSGWSGRNAWMKEDRLVGHEPEERGEELDRRLIRPVEVVEDEDERPLRGEPAEELAHAPRDELLERVARDPGDRAPRPRPGAGGP
jgi:hypothetical protein